MKKNIEKLTYIILNFFAITITIAFTFFNFNREIIFTCPLMQTTYITKMVYIVWGFLIIGYVAGASICALFKVKSDALCNAYQKRHENISIEKDNNDAKIATLEAKIATLEIALEKALKNK